MAAHRNGAVRDPPPPACPAMALPTRPVSLASRLTSHGCVDTPLSHVHSWLSTLDPTPFGCWDAERRPFYLRVALIPLGAGDGPPPSRTHTTCPSRHAVAYSVGHPLAGAHGSQGGQPAGRLALACKFLDLSAGQTGANPCSRRRLCRWHAARVCA